MRGLKLLAALTLVSFVGACGGNSLGGDQAAKFAGAWKFSGGTLTPTCGQGLNVPAFALTNLTVTFSKVDDSTIQVVTGNAGCALKFTVSGNVATATAGQTCTLDTGTALGVQTVSVTSWTLTYAGTETITTNISAAIAFCTATGMGVLTPAPSDGGAD
ncbi:MAG TPA: hypothetical protein VHJ20_14330 [Polyangia bacterium]|nr:hypothetical protein [Polyangia bacterium]